MGVASETADAARLAALGEGSVSRAVGLADAELERFRRSLIDEVAAEHGFRSTCAGPSASGIHQAGGQGIGRPARRASLLIGELARFFRGVLWQTAGVAPPCPDADDRQAVASTGRIASSPRMCSSLADRCIEADYYLARRVYLPLILSSLMHDLGKVVNPK